MKHDIKTLETAAADAIGGRNGHSETTDHSVKADLSVRKGMGGPALPNTTTPEHLFAAGYAACFNGAIDFVASQKKMSAKNTKVHCDVAIGPREGGGFGVGVKMTVHDDTIPHAQLVELAQTAHDDICPYSHATRGNIPFELIVKGA